jgi:hypothetical protein
MVIRPMPALRGAIAVAASLIRPGARAEFERPPASFKCVMSRL